MEGRASSAVDAYQRYAPALLRKAERMLQSRDDAKDIVQSLFLDLLQAGGAEPPSLPFLYRAVTNRCLNYLRDRGNRARLLEQADPALRGPARLSCEEQVIGVDMLAKLVSAIDAGTCEMIVYRYVDDLSQDEIAELTGYSRKTVGKRLERAREAVRTLTSTRGDDA
jgi:RNA polymerase sigma factor (sigma-70 family)